MPCGASISYSFGEVSRKSSRFLTTMVSRFRNSGIHCVTKCRSMFCSSSIWGTTPSAHHSCELLNEVPSGDTWKRYTRSASMNSPIIWSTDVMSPANPSMFCSFMAQRTSSVSRPSFVSNARRCSCSAVMSNATSKRAGRPSQSTTLSLSR